MPSLQMLGVALVVLAAIFVASIYLFGIPAEIKRSIEERVVETMGENEAADIVKAAVKKVPAADEQDVQELKELDGVRGGAGGILRNPLNQQADELEDEAFKDFAER